MYTLIISSFTTFSIETAQVFIPTRVSQISDVLLNIAGALTGVFVVFFSAKWSVILQEERKTTGC